MVSRNKNFPFEKVLWACFLKKAAMQWSAKNLQLWFWLCFWKFQFNQNEKDSQPSFEFYFQSEGEIFSLGHLFESRNSMKWKGLSFVSTVIWAFFSQQKLSCPFWVFFWKSQFNDMKRTFICYSDFPFSGPCWKSQFNENEKDFQLWFWLCFHSTS